MALHRHKGRGGRRPRPKPRRIAMVCLAALMSGCAHDGYIDYSFNPYTGEWELVRFHSALVSGNTIGVQE